MTLTLENLFPQLRCYFRHTVNIQLIEWLINDLEFFVYLMRRFSSLYEELFECQRYLYWLLLKGVDELYWTLMIYIEQFTVRIFFASKRFSKKSFPCMKLLNTHLSACCLHFRNNFLKSHKIMNIKQIAFNRRCGAIIWEHNFLCIWKQFGCNLNTVTNVQ
jgi:hypothetical protein